MTAEVTTVIGQLNIREGDWRGDAPNQVAVREPKAADAPGAGKGDLFVLAEVQGEIGNAELLERQLAEAVRDAYYLARGSTTASLRRAFQVVGEHLYQRNAQVGVEKRIVAGVVALVMQHEDVFVAQIGPAAFFAILGDYVQRYPARSVWLDEVFPSGPLLGGEIGPDRDEPGLGLSAWIEPNLHHFRVEPGDMLILADSRLAGQLPLEDVMQAVASHNVKTAIKNLGKVARTKSGSALALAVIEEAQPVLGGLVAPPQLGKLWPRQRVAGTPAKAVAAERASVERLVEPDLAAESEPIPHVKASVPLAAPPSKSAQLEVAAEAEAKPREREPRQEVHQPRDRVMASMMREPNFNTEPHRYRPAARQQPAAGKAWQWLSAGPVLFVALLVGGLKTMLRLVLPAHESHARPQAGMQAYRPQSTAIPWAVLRNIAIAIPILIGLIVGVSYLQKGRLREAEYAELLQNAQSKFQQAQAVDAATARSLMAESEALLAQAEQIKAGQPEITDLRTKMAEQSDKIGKVQRLYYLPQLRQYTDPGTNLKTIVVQGVEIYVLDSGNDRVFHHRLEDTGEALLPDDEAVMLVSRGQDVEGIATADLLDMVWMPVGGNRQTSDLLIFNTSDLLEYNPNWGITTAALAGRESLSSPTALSSFFGNLYVLDPPANRLWRYLPTSDGYSASPESYFPDGQAVDLKNAVDLTIDGAVYILFQDGRISKYMGGKPVDFSLTGLDKPLSNPVAIFTAPDEEVQHVYVADAGNQRVVQFNKDGSFVRQFKPRPGEAVSFANLQDIFVDEISGRLYLLDSNNLYLANIPAQ